jgi:FK506-binding nuclear protein
VDGRPGWTLSVAKKYKKNKNKNTTSIYILILLYKHSKMSSGRRIRKQSNDDADRPERETSPKRRKTTTSTTTTTHTSSHPPSSSPSPTAPHDDSNTSSTTTTKSRKELRKEKKASKIKPASTASNKTETNKSSKSLATTSVQVPLTAEEINQLKQQRQKELRKQNKVAGAKAKQERNEAHDRARKVMKETRAKAAQEKEKEPQKKKVAAKRSKKSKESSHDVVVEMDVYNSLFKGTVDPSNGTTTCRLGVNYKDKVVGKGNLVQDRTMITVKYQLTGGKFGAVLDSSNKFNFTLGKGEVIQGWDIGILGMRQGGTRHLIVPPKAGYGSKDIGAGPGAPLNFDITLLSC